MLIVRLAKLLGLMGVLVLVTMTSLGEAACPACSGIGQSRGYYAPPSYYGGYGPGQGYPIQYQAQPTRSKPSKSKKKSSKQKPAAQ